MKTTMWAALIGLAVGGVSTAHAQVILAPRSGGTFGGGVGMRPGGPVNPLVPLLYGGALTGNNPVGMIGPGSLRPGIGVAPSVVSGTSGDAGTVGFGSSVNDLNTGFVTGHPVAFQSYRGHFLNPNAAAGMMAGDPSGQAAGSTTPRTPNFGILGNSTNTPGKRPVKPQTGK